MKEISVLIEDLARKGKAWQAEHPNSTYAPRDEHAEHIERMRERIPKRYRHAVTECALLDGSLYLLGKAGTGKTFAAASEAIRAAERGERIAWLNVPSWLAEHKASYNGGPQPRSAEEVSRTDVLILDDLGAERPTDWARESLFVLVNRAYEESVRIIVTSNVQPSALVKSLGERIVSRLMHECQVVRFDGPDRRRIEAGMRE